jgi:voltage-gated potassium channel
MDSDTENVFTILTARELKPGIHLVARASERDTTRKLKMVGADRVVSPYVTSGRRMAAMALHPEVVDFLDYFTQPLQEFELELSTVEVAAGSELDGTSLKQADLRRRSGAMVLAVRSGGKTLFNPEAEMVLEGGMRLMVLGRQDQVRRLEEIAGQG